MAKKKKAYRKIRGAAFSLALTPTLWEGSDHLLSVEAVVFQERYKRFFYKDIQAIVMHRTHTHMVWATLWGVLALLCLLKIILTSGIAYVSIGLLSFFLLLLIVNVVLGPACRVQIQTAVQIQQLRSLRRMRRAAKVMDRLKAHIENAQGVLDTSALSSALTTAEEPSTPSVHIGPLPNTAGQTAFQREVEIFHPLLHRVMFCVLLTLGVLGLVQFYIDSLSLSVVESILHAIAQILVIVALVRGFRQLKGTWLAKLSWISLGVTLAITGTGYILLLVTSFRHPDLVYNNWELYKKTVELMSGAHPFLLTINLVSTAGLLMLGTLGLLALHRHAQTSSAQTVDDP